MRCSPLFCLLAVCLVTGMAAGCASTEPRYAKTTGLIEPGMRAFAEFDARLEVLARGRGWTFVRLAPGAAPSGTFPPGVIYRWVLISHATQDKPQQSLTLDLLGVDVARPMKDDERRVNVNGVPVLLRITPVGVDLTLSELATKLSDPNIK